MDVVKILEVEKEVLKRINMICRFACCKYSIKQGSIMKIIVSKEKWNACQYQTQRNAKHYERTATYLFTNKLKCSVCGNFLGGKATTKRKNGNKYYYYKCEKCKTNYKEDTIRDGLLLQLYDLIRNIRKRIRLLRLVVFFVYTKFLII